MQMLATYAGMHADQQCTLHVLRAPALGPEMRMTATPLRPGPELSATIVSLQLSSTGAAVMLCIGSLLVCGLTMLATARVCLPQICCCARGPCGANCRRHVRGW